MTGKDLLQAMNYLEDEMVEQVAPTTSNAQITPVHNRKSKFAKTALKWSAAAAAALLLFGGGVAYAAKYGIMRTNPGWESGYHVDITSRRVTEDEFSEEVRAVKQELLEDIATLEDAENREVFGWIQHFNTLEESVAFINHEGLKAPAFPYEESLSGVVVIGNNKADIMYTLSFANYQTDTLWASMSSRMYTDAYPYPTGAGIKEDGLQYADEIYITANNMEAFLVYSAESKYPGNRGIQAYLVDDSVVYELWVSCYNHNQDEVIQLVKDWLDQF